MNFLSERQLLLLYSCKVRVPPSQGKSLSLTSSSGIGCLPCAPPPLARATIGARWHFLPLDSSTPCFRLHAINHSECGECAFSDAGSRLRGLDRLSVLAKKQQSGSNNPETSGDMSWCIAPTSPAVWGAARSG